MNLNRYLAKVFPAMLILSTAISSTFTLAAETSPNQVFSDLSHISKKKQDAIAKAVRQGLITGNLDGKFRPDDELTRQEVAVLLTNALHLKPIANSNSTFHDVFSGDWGSPYIEAVRQAGLMNGDGNRFFHPNNVVSREELATVFVRAINGVDDHGGKRASLLDSTSVSSWAGEAVDTAVRLGLLNLADNKFDPKGKVMRQDIADFLLNIFQVQERSAVITKVDGDMVVIDGTPYLIEGKLKQLISENNGKALQGAILKFKSVNRNVGHLLELEIVQSGVTLDTGSFDGALRISGDKVTIKGDTISQVELAKGASSVVLNATVNQIVVNTDQPIYLTGTAAVGELKVNNSNARINLGQTINVSSFQLPENVKKSQVIETIGLVKQPIQNDRGGSNESSSQPTPTPKPKPINHNPKVKIQPSNLTMTLGDTAKKIDFANNFEDEEGDTILYSAKVSNPAVASVVVAGSIVTVTPLQAGTAIITITADDGHGGTVQTQFNVTIEEQAAVNHPPKVVKTIAPLVANVADGAKTISLAGVFSDADNDTLSYSAVSSLPGVATALVNGNDLKITPVSAGTTKITVTADDGYGGTVQTQFNVTFEVGVPKGLFISELVWGQSDSFLQAIELYNPTSQNIDASKIRIERANGGNPITLENGTISSGGIFTIVESFYFGTDIGVDYNLMMNFYAEDTQPVTLSLYYDNKLIDIAVFYPHKSVGRVSGTVIGSTTSYDAAQWKVEGVDYIDDLGKFTP
ncbi:S-layer homology domain-containing protein [Paenibacillus sp. KN14-4R]|uniref:S-layer homology domain-containing protein n=1 Tax=Paenibacillus sp. KN14-4R TaxID=3445773 RepID=UPI003FA196D0